MLAEVVPGIEDLTGVFAPHVTLIRPPFLTMPSTLVGAQATPSLALALLGAVCIERGYGVTAIDATGERIDQYRPLGDTGYFIHGLNAEEIVARIPGHTGLIGVTCMFSNEWLYHRQVIDAIARAFPGVPLLVGGEHATAASEYVLNSCPGVIACVLGEGEDTLLDVLDAVASGRALTEIPGLLVRSPDGDSIKTAARSRVRNLDKLPWPAWDLMPIRKYLDIGAGHGTVGKRTMPMLASRGCPYRCTFCSNPSMWGKLWNIRSAEDVVAEMKHYKEKYDANSFSFYDLTAVIRKEWILRFVRCIEEAQLDISWLLPSGTRSEALDDEVVRAMRRSGCYTLNLAPESGSPHTLKRIKKQVDLEKMLATVRACARAGIYARANIIYGFPGEAPRDMVKTAWFIVRLAWHGLHDIGVFPFAPYPGSELHKELRAAGAFPPDGDEYDRILAANLNNNYRKPQSWNEHLSDGQLRFLLVGSSLMFYACQYLFRPWRFVSSMMRLASGAPVTFIERVLYNVVQRFRFMADDRAGEAAPEPAKPARREIKDYV